MQCNGFDQPGVALQTKIALLHGANVLVPPIAVRNETCRNSVVLEDGRDLVIVGSSNGDVHVTTDGWEWSHLQNDHGIMSVAAAPSGRILAETDWYTNVWDVGEGEGEFVRGHQVTKAGLSTCGHMMAYYDTRGTDRGVRVVEVESGRVLESVRIDTVFPIRPIVWSPNCRLVSMGWLGGNVATWRLGDSQLMWQTQLGKFGPRIRLEIRRFCWSPNGQLLACLMGGWDMPSIYVTTAGGEMLVRLDAPEFAVDIFFVGNCDLAAVGERGDLVFYKLP